MLDKLTYENFEKLIDQKFTVKIDNDISFDFILSSVKLFNKQHENQERTPFSITFAGPNEPQLPQATYEFTHPEMGTTQIFIVPVHADHESVYYEAIFS